MIQGLSEKLKSLRLQFNYSQKEVSDLFPDSTEGWLFCREIPDIIKKR